MVINHERMKEIDQVYMDAFVHVTNSLEAETRKAVLQAWRKIVSTEKAYLLVTDSGSRRIRGHIFGDSVLTDFMLQFNYVFMTMWSPSADEVKGLIAKLAFNLSQCMGSQTKVSLEDPYMATPKDNLDRMSSYDDVVGVLTANNWLLTVVISSVFITHHEIDRLLGSAKTPGG